MRKTSIVKNETESFPGWRLVYNSDRVAYRIQWKVNNSWRHWPAYRWIYTYKAAVDHWNLAFGKAARGEK